MRLSDAISLVNPSFEQAAVDAKATQACEVIVKTVEAYESGGHDAALDYIDTLYDGGLQAIGRAVIKACIAGEKWCIGQIGKPTEEK